MQKIKKGHFGVPRRDDRIKLRWNMEKQMAKMWAKFV
jgi:hypothetical protein